MPKMQEVLKFNLVLVGIRLLEGEGEFRRFQNAVGKEVSKQGGDLTIEIAGSALPGIAGGAMPIPNLSQNLRIGSEQVSVDLALDRTTFTREYPTLEDIDRFVEIIVAAVQYSSTSGRSVRAFGYNLEAVVRISPPETAAQFMTEHVIAGHSLTASGYEINSASVSMSCIRNGKLWNIKIEPRQGNANALFMSLNFHHDEKRIPPKKDIEEALHQIWNEVDVVVNSFQEGM